MIQKLTQDLVGKWLVNYGASGFAVCYGEIISVNEKDEIINAIDGISKEKRGFGRHNVFFFETKKEAKKEYEEYQFAEE
ncbi:MAG TPA: hypothetical protein DIT25_03725 [Candidatus Moranbacteria bacterium]|nr:hypothetical protein [Candidatus Moranbacteria bacterium]